jgi:hypothetical protein
MPNFFKAKALYIVPVKFNDTLKIKLLKKILDQEFTVKIFLENFLYDE